MARFPLLPLLKRPMLDALEAVSDEVTAFAAFKRPPGYIAGLMAVATDG